MPVLAIACLVGLLLPLLSKFYVEWEGMLVWLVDLAVHWQWLFLIGLLFAGVVLTWRNLRWVMLFLAAPLPYLTASAQAPHVAAEGNTLTVASANVSLSNREPSTLVEWITKQNVDLVALFEVSPDYSAKLGAEADFPFRKIIPSEGPFGIAMMSQHPITDVSVIRDKDGIAHIEANLEWESETVKVVAIHPMPPIEPRYRVVRDTKLRTLAKAAVDQGDPAIVVGDINATPWSSAFSGLEGRGLRRATGLNPSWPAALGGFIGIPIDHVLVTSHWGLVKYEVGPDLGSDHFPVIARLSLRFASTSH